MDSYGQIKKSAYHDFFFITLPMKFHNQAPRLEGSYIRAIGKLSF